MKYEHKMNAQKIIIIHPGSQNLRIGRASDLNPTTVLHAIAYKVKNSNLANDQKTYRDLLLPTTVDNKSVQNEFEEHRLEVSHLIQSYIPKSEDKGRGSKRQRIATPPQQIASFNKRTEPEIIELKATLEVKSEQDDNVSDKDILYDNDILNLTSKEAEQYFIHFPFRRGELNIHSGIGGSLSAVIAFLETIWKYVLVQKLAIPLEKLPQYCCVLVIPNIYNRTHLRELVTLLLQRIKFRACFLVQDDVSATFGSGLSYGCVVDIGDEKCSISCVEDGISHHDTRVRLCYGGGDITQVFQNLLRKCSFPYKECNFYGLDFRDSFLLQSLKERFCHTDLDMTGAQEKSFEVQREKDIIKKYTIQLGDECLIAPLSLFHTELLNVTGKCKLVFTQLPCSQQSDPEDCFDAEYIRETGRRNGRDQLLEGSVLPVTGDTPEDEIVVDNEEEKETTNKNSDKEEQIYYSSTGQIVSLEQAIMGSIDRCTTEEMKRKMFSSILLVGSSTKFPCFSKFLENKLKLAISQTNSRSSETTAYEIFVITKEMDPGIIAWKGAAIMSCLESATELWINSLEWEKYGLRTLREKAPFMW